MEEIQGKSVLIVGYGREGKSVEVWLTKHYPHTKIVVSDSWHIPEKLFDTIIRSPGVSPYTLRLPGHITSATNIFFSRVTGVTIGITGTKGKSTTTSLIAHILSAHDKDVRLVGNIGKPMLDELDSSTKDTVFVIELSSHQLADIRYSPHVAVVLDIVPEHLDYYPDFETYKKAKENIFRFQKPGDHVIYSDTSLVNYPTKLIGNEKNISVAVRVARFMQVPEEVIQKRLATFTPLPHRLEFVGEYRGIRFYNDSLATIPEATIHALNALGPEVSTLIAGGYDRNLDFSMLRDFLTTHPVKTLLLFPDTGEKIGNNAIQKKFFVHTMREAVTLAYKHTPKGKICLLSPASASYNLFKNYEDRGDQFKEWVKKLGNNQGFTHAPK